MHQLPTYGFISICERMISAIGPSRMFSGVAPDAKLLRGNRQRRILDPKPYSSQW